MEIAKPCTRNLTIMAAFQGLSLRVLMYRRYAIRSASSASGIADAENPRIYLRGQVRTPAGSRISAASAFTSKYSVGFMGRFKSGPIDPAPLPFILWHAKQFFWNDLKPF